MILKIKKILKKFIPDFILKYREKRKVYKMRNEFINMSRYDIFKKIYLKKIWSPDNEKSKHKFYSGVGSHFSELTNKYIYEVNVFLSSFSSKPNVVDLGCGDFAIGSKIRKLCNNYYAIDIFDELINFNKKKYDDLNVDFKVLDITKDQLPSADICFVRQVLQHLSNEDIKSFIRLINGKYKYLILTEHYPKLKNFTANLDKPTGPDIRFYDNSAVVLTEPPFNLKTIKNINFCETYSSFIEGSLNTKLLQFKD